MSEVLARQVRRAIFEKFKTVDEAFKVRVYLTVILKSLRACYQSAYVQSVCAQTPRQGGNHKRSHSLISHNFCKKWL